MHKFLSDSFRSDHSMMKNYIFERGQTVEKIMYKNHHRG
jgi:hypothetical protein